MTRPPDQWLTADDLVANHDGMDLHRVDLPDLSRTALLVVDVQRWFDDAEYWGRDNPGCEDNVPAC